MIVSYKYKLKGRKAKQQLAEYAKAVNIVWNYCVETHKQVYKQWKNGQKPRWLTRFDYCTLTSGPCKELGIHSQTINEIDRYFVQSRDIHKKCPRFRKSYGSNRSLGWVPFTRQARRIYSNSVKYLGFNYKFFGAKKRPLPPTATAGNFFEDCRGDWWVVFQVEVKIDNNHGDKEQGLDLGLKSFVTTSEGAKYENPAYYRKTEGKLKIADRSHNYAKVRALNVKVKNQRQDYLHKLSTKLVNESSLIIVGNVKTTPGLKGMLKSRLDASWGGFKAMLRYKASRHGVKYLEVNESFTTQTCSRCGARPEGRPKGIAGLGIREWVCSSCGSTHDRDVNAAKNILILGRGAPPPVEGSQRAISAGDAQPKDCCVVSSLVLH